LELSVVLGNHPEVTHYWSGEQFFSVSQILEGKCPDVRPDSNVESHVDATGRMHINKLGKHGRRRVFAMLSQALLSDFEVDPAESPCVDCLAPIPIAAKILMCDEDAVRNLITTGQLTARIDDEGEIAVPVRELERLVPEWWNVIGPNRA
jgi:hypothetical protein